MTLNYTVYQYDGSRNAVVMTDMEGKQLVIDCDKAEEKVVFDEPEDAGILARLARKEPASYVSIAMRPGGLQDYVLKVHGLKVSSLYISQVKRKCGIEVGENYNLPKSEDSRQPQCPVEKEKAIRDALEHYGMV